MFKLLVLLNITMDDRSVWISIAFQKTDFQKRKTPYDNEFGTVNKYFQFHETLGSSTVFRKTSYWRQYVSSSSLCRTMYVVKGKCIGKYQPLDIIVSTVKHIFEQQSIRLWESLCMQQFSKVTTQTIKTHSYEPAWVIFYSETIQNGTIDPNQLAFFINL